MSVISEKEATALVTEIGFLVSSYGQNLQSLEEKEHILCSNASILAGYDGAKVLIEEIHPLMEHLNKAIKEAKEAKEKYDDSAKEIRENNNSYGCKDETKKKISETLKGKMTGANNPTSKRIVCIDTGEIFDCCRDACKKYDLCPGNLSRCLKEGKRIKGLLFNYIL